MSVRIVQLEEALATLQSQLFPHPHPLLTDDRVKIPLAPRDSPLKDAPSSDDEAELVSSIGAFSIREKGEVVFHEDTANTEVCQHILLRDRVSHPTIVSFTGSSLQSISPPLTL